MSAFEVLMTFVVPASILLMGASAVVSAARTKRGTGGWFPGWLVLMVMVIAASDALAGGPHRSTWERSWKGATVVLFATAMALSRWRSRKPQPSKSNATS